MTLEIGDKVRIKSFEEIVKTFNGIKKTNGCNFMEHMKLYCGKVYEIDDIDGYGIHERINFKGCPYYWVRHWLEKDIKPVLSDDLFMLSDDLFTLD